MKITVIGNCNVHGIADSLQFLREQDEVFSLEVAVAERSGAIPSAIELIRSTDLIFAQNIPARFGALSIDTLREAHPNVELIPSLAFTGFHPDCVLLTNSGELGFSPVGVYHSAIAAGAFALGIDEAEATGLFNPFVYRKLGYFEEYGKASTFMRREFEALGYSVDDEWRSWLARGPFMHTTNHPKVHVLASVGKLAAIKAGLVSSSAATPTLWFDWLAQNTIWPVYPELARSIGVDGNYIFKRYAQINPAMDRSILMGLSRFVRESYEIYAGWPREAFDDAVLAKTKSTLAELAPGLVTAAQST